MPEERSEGIRFFSSACGVHVVILSIPYVLTDSTFLVLEKPAFSPNLFMHQLTSASITVDL